MNNRKFAALERKLKKLAGVQEYDFERGEVVYRKVSPRDASAKNSTELHYDLGYVDWWDNDSKNFLAYVTAAYSPEYIQDRNRPFVVRVHDSNDSNNPIYSEQEFFSNAKDTLNYFKSASNELFHKYGEPSSAVIADIDNYRFMWEAMVTSPTPIAKVLPAIAPKPEPSVNKHKFTNDNNDEIWDLDTSSFRTQLNRKLNQRTFGKGELRKRS